MLPAADVFLPKSAESPDSRLIDEIQEWLVAQGFDDIAFKRSTNAGPPPTIREYRSGRVLLPSERN